MISKDNFVISNTRRCILLHSAFTYDNENRPTNLSFGSSRQVAYTYDGLGRITQRTLNAGNSDIASNYTYVAGGFGTNSTSPLVQSITQLGSTLTYAYDSTGNITSVSNGTKTITYVYDLLGELIRANDPLDTTAGTNGTTWVYSYDLGGNILSKTAYAYTTGTVGTAVQTNTYAYGDANWKDKLTAFNGTAITYDAIGNPLNDGTWTYTWAQGRQLQSMAKTGTTVSYAYNQDGLRVQKNVNGTVTNYVLHGNNIVHMTQGSNALHFFYDAQNSPAVVEYNGVSYGYVKNLQGDIIAIVNASGTKVVEYVYDAWGKLLSKTGSMASALGTLNPFRYRGYVYDEETGLYYLQSRYYNPTWGRFINADAIGNLGADGELLSYNLFTNCINNPVNRFDLTGNWSLPNWAKVVIGTVALAGAIALTVATGGGAAVVAAGVAKVVGSVALSTAISAGVGYVENGIEGAKDAAANGYMFGSLSALGGAALRYISSPANGIDTYKNLRKVNKGTGNQVHHIVEKRFASTLGIDNTDEMLSIALTKESHQVITNAWRTALPYGASYTKTQILGASVKVYYKSPRMLVSAVRTLL